MTQRELVHIPTKYITTSERARQDYGGRKEWEDFKESIRIKGILQPITVKANPGTGGGYQLLAGGRRLRAAMELEIDRVPALVYESKGAADEKEIELFENIYRKNLTWQEEARLVEAIHNHYREVNPNWRQEDTAKLLDRSEGGISRKLDVAKFIKEIPELKELKTEDDAVKAVKKMEERLIVRELAKRQREGQAPVFDLTRLADHHYQVGDAIKGLLATGEDRVAFTFIECDPSYGIDLHDAKRREDKTQELEGYTEVDTDEYPEFLNKLAYQLHRVAAPNSWLVFWFGPTWHSVVWDALNKAGWKVDPIPAIWDKGGGQTQQPSTYLARAYEPFFVARKGNPVLRKEGRSNVFTFSPVPGPKKRHPTQRPIELMGELIDTFLFPGRSVLSPFLGSGVTLLAAYERGMTGMGWDLHQENKDRFLLEVQIMAEKRLKNAKEE